MRHAVLRPFVALLLTAAFAQTGHATCGAEGCPCVPNGVSSSRFAFDVRTLEVTQDKLWRGTGTVALNDAISTTAFHHDVPLYSRTRTWSFEARAQLTSQLRLSASVPYLDREYRRYDAHFLGGYNPALVQSWRFRGIGDATALVHANVFERAGGPRVALRMGAKLPTGRRDVPIGKGLIPAQIQPVLRPGSGSWDLIAGASVSQPMPWQPIMPLALDVQRRWNTRGTDEYLAGDELQSSLSTGWVVRPGFAITALANYAQHGGDSWTEPTPTDIYRHPAHAGARALYLTPGANVSLPGGMGLYAAWQNRVWGRSDHATVVADRYLLLGLSYSLAN